MLGQCWPNVNDAGPTVAQHWLTSSCLLGASRSKRQIGLWGMPLNGPYTPRGQIPTLSR